MPKEYAYDFLVFCSRNPKSCSLLEVSERRVYEPVCAPNAYVRKDVPKYRIYSNGACKEEINDMTKYWREDLVSFCLRCSFTFKSVLLSTRRDCASS